MGGLQPLQLSATQIQPIEPQSAVAEPFERLIARFAEAHIGLLAGQHHLHGFKILLLPAFAPLQQKDEACCDDAEGFDVADADDPALIHPYAAAAESMGAAVLPAVDRGQQQGCPAGRQQHPPAKGVLQLPEHRVATRPALALGPAQAPPGSRTKLRLRCLASAGGAHRAGRCLRRSSGRDTRAVISTYTRMPSLSPSRPAPWRLANSRASPGLRIAVTMPVVRP